MLFEKNENKQKVFNLKDLLLNEGIKWTMDWTYQGIILV